MKSKMILAAGALATVLTAGTLGGSAAIAQDYGGDRFFEGSLKAPATDLESDLAEDHELEGLAKVERAGAEEAALREIPGEATSTEIEEEYGYVVWVVNVTDIEGDRHEVTVDAGNGEVLARELEEQAGEDFSEADDDFDDDGDDRFDD
jgi:uncharacterized membrane protein YkoI